MPEPAKKNLRVRFSLGSILLLIATAAMSAAGMTYLVRVSSSRNVQDHFIFSILVLLGPMLLMICASFVHQIYDYFSKKRPMR